MKSWFLNRSGGRVCCLVASRACCPVRVTDLSALSRSRVSGSRAWRWLMSRVARLSMPLKVSFVRRTLGLCGDTEMVR